MLFGRLDAEGDVALQLLLEPQLQVLAGDVLAFAADEWRRIDAEHHLNRRLIDRHARHRAADLGVAHRVANRDVFEADERGDVAGGGFRGGHAAELIE